MTGRLPPDAEMPSDPRVPPGIDRRRVAPRHREGDLRGSRRLGALGVVVRLFGEEAIPSSGALGEPQSW